MTASVGLRFWSKLLAYIGIVVFGITSVVLITWWPGRIALVCGWMVGVLMGYWWDK
jgi:hypothetical protein